MTSNLARCCGVFLVSLSLISCGTVSKFKESASLKDFVSGKFSGKTPEDTGILSTSYSPKTTIETIWSKKIGKGADNLYLNLKPTIIGAYLYVASKDGQLAAIDTSNGSTIWEIHDKNITYTSAPGSGDGMVLMGTGDGRVIARNAKTGKLRWVARVSSEVLAAPQAFNNVTVTRTGDGKLYGLRSETGEELWNYDRTVPSLTLRGNAAPVISGNNVYAGFDSGRFVALDLKTGQAKWDSPLAIASGRSDLERMVDVDSEPTVLRDTVFAASFNGGVSAISTLDGTIKWTREISSFAGISVGGNLVYVTDADGAIWALNTATGASVWKKETLEDRFPTGPTYYNGKVVVSDYEGYTYWMDAKNGDFISKQRFDKSRVLSKALNASDMAIIFSSQGRVTATRAP